MDKDCIKRSVSRGVRETVHNLVQGEIWECWKQVKESQGAPESCFSIVELRADESPSKRQHIVFAGTSWVFHMPTTVGTDATLVIASLGNEEVLLLEEEAKQVFGEITKE